MKIRFGLCLLPALFAGACTTANNAKMTAAASSPTESFAMLPDSVAAVPYAAGASAPGRAAAEQVAMVQSGSMSVPATSSNPNVDRLITAYAQSYQVPEALVRRVVKRESNFRPAARNGKYWGLMQILPATARSMGYDGPAQGLLDAETNLKYAVKYLKGAYMVAGGDHDQAVRNYSRGYYYEAKRKGMLNAVDGLVAPRTRMPGDVMVASAASPVSGKMPAASLARQWQTGVASASNGATQVAEIFPASSRFGRPAATPVSATRAIATGTTMAASSASLSAAGAEATPALGMTAPTQ